MANKVSDWHPGGVEILFSTMASVSSSTRVSASQSQHLKLNKFQILKRIQWSEALVVAFCCKIMASSVQTWRFFPPCHAVKWPWKDHESNCLLRWPRFPCFSLADGIQWNSRSMTDSDSNQSIREKMGFKLTTLSWCKIGVISAVLLKVGWGVKSHP